MPVAEGAVSDLFGRPLFFSLYDWFIEVPFLFGNVFIIFHLCILHMAPTCLVVDALMTMLLFGCRYKRKVQKNNKSIVLYFWL